MKINGIKLDTTAKFAEIYAQYTSGDLETLEDVNTMEDYTLMPTKEVQALVDAVEENYPECDGDCADCELSEDCDNYEEYYPEPLFGGAYYDEDDEFVYIKRVVYNAPNTVVIWSDGTKTSSTCGENDTYNPEMGLALAVLKKITSSEFTVKTLHDWAPNDSREGDTTTKAIKTLKDVRREHKTQPKKDA